MDTVTVVYTGVLRTKSGRERTDVKVRAGMTYADIIAEAAGAREAGLGQTGKQGLPDGVILFYRTQTGGLQRIHDLSVPVDPDRRELVLTTSMSGG